MKLDNETISFLTFFERLTHARIKDCFFEKERFVFVVELGEKSKAIGKQGSNVKRMELMSKKKIKIVEFNPEVKNFIRNYLMPLQTQEITEKDNIIFIKMNGMREKGLLIGRDKANIEHLKEIVKKYFIVEDIKVM